MAKRVQRSGQIKSWLCRSAPWLQHLHIKQGLIVAVALLGAVAARPQHAIIRPGRLIAPAPGISAGETA